MKLTASTCCLLLLGILGGVLILNGAMVGPRHHRLVAVTIGAALVVPFVIVLFFGSKGKTFVKRVVFAMTPCLLLLLALEVVLRVADMEVFQVPVRKADPALHFRLQPGTGGMDAWGFRNVEVPRKADLVFLGDSQTYGHGVLRSEAFPSRVQTLCGKTTYNMGVPGYGPVHYLYLTEQALSLRPETLLICFYFGNDLPDASRLLRLDHWRELRDPYLEYPPLKPFAQGSRSRINLGFQFVEALQEHSVFVSWLGHEARWRLRQHSSFASIYGADQVSRLEGPISTVFTPSYRLRVQDPTDEKVQDGFRVTESCLQQIAERADQANCAVVLCLIHTKEYWYHRLLTQQNDKQAEQLAELAHAEEDWAQRLQEVAAALEIKVIDPTDDVVAALQAEQAVYAINADGHPTRGGHNVLAQSIGRQLGGREP